MITKNVSHDVAVSTITSELNGLPFSVLAQLLTNISASGHYQNHEHFTTETGEEVNAFTVEAVAA